MEKIYDPDLKSIRLQAQYKIQNLINNDDDKPLLFMFSGGSCMELLNNFDFEAKGNVTLTVLDERASNNPTENNFSLLTETDFFKACMDQADFIDTRLNEDEEKEGLALRFEQELRRWKKNNPQGIIIATVGIGTDGHISGIPPMPENSELFNRLFEDTDKWVQPLNADELGWDNPHKERVTTTLPFLKQIDFGVVYVVGENKRIPLQRALSRDEEYNHIPAAVLQEMQNVFIFTDINLLSNLH
jgi:6-phosphogluconolactonase/glucosamine-6-phosphate isomerase/deaminase